MPNIKGKIFRVAVWFILLLSAFAVAYINGIATNNEKRKETLQILKREINSNWGLTKLEIDMINESTQSYIERKGLKPGDPLPPKILAQENPALLSMLKNMKTYYFIKTFSATSSELSTKAIAIITINSRVPQEGERYAYGAIEHNYEIFGSVYSIYPEDEFAMRRILKALKAYSKSINN